MKEKRLMMGAVLLLALVMNTSALAGEVHEDKENDLCWAGEENEDKKIERRWAGVYKYVSEVFPILSSEEQEAIAQSIYQEKYVIVPEAAPSDNAPNDASVKEQEESIFQGKYVPEAYYLMMERENYIVDLITSHSGTETTIEAWEYNLDYLNAHYEEIMSLENVNQIYVEVYIEENEAFRSCADIPLSRTNGPRTFNSSYSSGEACRYAKTYYKDYNPEYPNWAVDYGGDCANFVSQCLRAGGKDMVGTPGTSEAAQNISNWFSYGSSCDTKYVSSSWRGANSFMKYWKVNASAEDFSSMDSEAYEYAFSGDAISLLDSTGKAYHTLMVYGFDPANEDIIVAAHTGDTITKKLSEYFMPGGFIIYSMR